MRYIACFITCLLLLSMAFANRSFAGQAPQIEETYSFENDFEGWTIRSNQQEPNLPPPVTRSQERAVDGTTALRLIVNRLGVFQGVWIEKSFTIEPNQIYDVSIDYSLASKDCCRSNPSYILTGIINKSPDPAIRDLAPTGQGIADNGEETFSDFKWLNKEYEFTVRTDEQGKLYAIVGIGGNEATRSYFFDKIHIKITKREIPCEFYSFENDLEGWTAKATDLDFQGSPVPWSVSPTDFVIQDGKKSLQFTIDSRNGNAKVWIEKVFFAEPKKKYRVKVEYGLFSQLDAPRSKIITGVLNTSAEGGQELEPFYQKKIGTYEPVWKRNQYEFQVKTKKSGLVYVVIGIFAEEAKLQAYSFDNVCVTITKK